MPQYVRFSLPDVGEGLTEADIVEWKVAVGDAVSVNQEIVEIETAKSLVDLPCPYAGVVTELLAGVGATVDVGAAIIVIDTDPDGEPAPDAAPSGAGTDAQSGEGSDSGASDSGGTDSEASGGVLVGYGTKGARSRRRRRSDRVEARHTGAENPPDNRAEPAAGSGGDDETLPHGEVSEHVLAKPPVRKLAKDLGVDLTRVPGTGPGGIITREDVEAAHEQEDTGKLTNYPDDDRPWLEGGTVSNDGRQTRVPVRSVRRRTAEAMVTSAFTAPHVTVFSTVDVSATMDLVARLREDGEFSGTRVTPLLIAAKALILAIRRNPTISASWDDETQEIVYKHYINLGIAAATPRGLVVPNIKDAHRMGLLELAEEIGSLTRTARAGKTTPAAMTDGTVTITNVGVFGLDTGTPILNPGESAILALGAIDQRPWVHDGEIKARWVTQLALSFDHRLVDGELGSRVLADVAKVMNDPTRGLVWG